MIKVYTCVSEISFNLKINGNKRRVIFDPISGGKSQYRTNEKDVQEGIERLDQFGRIIRLTNSIEEEGDDKDDDLDDLAAGEEGGGFEARAGGEAAGGENTEGGGLRSEGRTEKDVQEGIISFAEAKEYLLTHGCEKTIRSREHIMAYAAELGIEFPNLK